MSAAQEHGAGAMSRQHRLRERSSARRMKIFIARNSNRYIFLSFVSICRHFRFSIIGGAKCASRWRVSLSVLKRQLTALKRVE